MINYKISAVVIDISYVENIYIYLFRSLHVCWIKKLYIDIVGKYLLDCHTEWDLPISQCTQYQCWLFLLPAKIGHKKDTPPWKNCKNTRNIYLLFKMMSSDVLYCCSNL